MITLHASAERGQADHGWLKSQHSFSFADYLNPQRMGFANLRVINEDRVAAGTGFGTHGHRDMEIVSVVLDGALAHRDSLGNGSTIEPGDVQRMSAGTGVRHSEFNHSQQGVTHFLQIWLLPEKAGIEPSYEQRRFGPADKRGRLCLVGARASDPVFGSGGGNPALPQPLRLNADARLWVGLFDGAERAELALDASRPAYVHLARGELTVNGRRLRAGDALELTDEAQLSLQDGADAEVLVFELGR